MVVALLMSGLQYRPYKVLRSQYRREQTASRGRVGVFGIADMRRQAEWLTSQAQQDWGAEVWWNVKPEIDVTGEDTMYQIKIDAG
jgi:hypothetical protein